MIPKYIKKDILELSFSENKMSRKIYNYLLFSEFSLGTWNELFPKHLKIEGNQIYSFFQYLYENRSEYPFIYRDFFNKRANHIFIELSMNQRYSLLKDSHFFTDNPENLLETLNALLIDSEKESDTILISIENALLIPSDVMEKLQDRKTLLTLHIEYSIESLSKVPLLKENLPAFQTPDFLFEKFIAYIPYLKKKVEKNKHLEKGQEEWLVNFSNNQQVQLYIIENFDVFYFFFLNNKKEKISKRIKRESLRLKHDLLGISQILDKIQD